MNASSDRLLRRTLWGNAIFSVISGAVLAIFADPFAQVAAHGPVSLMGLDLAIVFELLGLGGLPRDPAAGLGPGYLRRRPCLGGW